MREVLQKNGKKELEIACTDNFTGCFVLKGSPEKNPPSYPYTPKISLHAPTLRIAERLATGSVLPGILESIEDGCERFYLTVLSKRVLYLLLLRLTAFRKHPIEGMALNLKPWITVDRWSTLSPNTSRDALTLRDGLCSPSWTRKDLSITRFLSW